MPDPQSSRIGKFTIKTARYSERGTFQIDEKGTPVSVPEIYTVVMPDAETRATASNVSGLPDVGDTHDVFTNLECTGLAFDQVDPTSRVWKITATYERTSSSVSSQGGEDDARVTALEWGFVSHTRELVADANNGLLVLNSAGDCFDKAVEVDVPDLQIHFARLEKKFVPAKLKLTGTVNKEEVEILGWTFPPYTARVQVTCRDTLDADAKYRFEYSYTITARSCVVDATNTDVRNADDAAQQGGLYDLGYRIPILDAGFNQLTADGKAKILIDDGNGGLSEPALPQMLDGSGHVPASAGAIPVAFVFSPYKAERWTALKLPTDYTAVEPSGGNNGGNGNA